jgi:bifunctional non-homologous end joining protein LigD
MARPLGPYASKRSFTRTPEPAPKVVSRAGPLLFVIQKHAARRLHYDFRLELDGVLKSWAVPKGPSYDPATKRLAMMTEDHPYDYASFEGVIPEGNYGAGNVIIWDQGTWDFVEPGDDPVKALKSGKLTFRMNGKKMFGEWALVRISGRGRSGDKGNEWLLLKHRDEFANDKLDITEFAPRSVVSNKLVDEVSPKKVWISNRTSTRGAPTIASKLAATAAKKKRAARATSSKKARAKPSRAASSRSRSSRGESPAKARPTRRRQPR